MYQNISVVTPVYNGQEFISECIKSVLLQEGVEVEHIIVDDGSTDETRQVVSAFPSVTLLRQEKKGACSARNLGLAYASGHFIKFLDADDILVCGAIEKQLCFRDGLEANQIGYGYAEDAWPCGTTRLNIRSEKSAVSRNPLADLIVRNIKTSLPLYPRSILHRTGGFNERLHARQEWDLHLRLCASGGRFLFDNVFVYQQRHHEGNDRITNRRWDFGEEYAGLQMSFESIAPYMSEIEVADAFAFKIWKEGRQFLVRGDRQSASKMFQWAKQISPEGYLRFSSKLYKLGVALMGPAFVEFASLKRRQLAPGAGLSLRHSGRRA